MKRLLCLMLLWPGCGCLVSAADEGASELAKVARIITPKFEPDPLPYPMPVPDLGPLPAPRPAGPVKPPVLEGDLICHFQSDQPLFFRFSVDGLVHVNKFVCEPNKQLCPIGHFIDGAIDSDGSRVREIRQSECKYLYFLEPVMSGTTRVFWWPAGATDEADIHDQVLTVVGPRPPPDPGPNPDPNPNPKPDPKPDPVAEHVRLSIVTDKAAISPTTAKVLNALVGWNALLDEGNEYRLYDVKSPEAEAKKAVAELGVTVPGIVVTDKADGKVLHKGPLPVTFDDLKALVGRLTGG